MPILDISLKPSKQYIFICAVLLLGSIASIFYIKLGGWVTLLILFLTCGYAYYVIGSYGFLLSKNAIRKICLMGDGTWTLTTARNGYIGYLCGESTVTRYFCVLRFAIAGKYFRRSCLIFRDTQERETYRRLLVSLYASKKSSSRKQK